MQPIPYFGEEFKGDWIVEPKIDGWRLQVMATLQAARAFLLGLPLESAKSWGLNRAIFYAEAKRVFNVAA